RVQRPVVDDPQPALHAEQEIIPLLQRLVFSGIEQPRVAQRRQRLPGVARPQRRPLPAVRQLQHLHQELHVGQPPRAALQVAGRPPRPARAGRGRAAPPPPPPHARRPRRPPRPPPAPRPPPPPPPPPPRRQGRPPGPPPPRAPAPAAPTTAPAPPGAPRSPRP